MTKEQQVKAQAVKAAKAIASATVKTLDSALKEVGLTKKDYTSFNSGYTVLTGEKRIKADIEAWKKVGKVSRKAKTYLKAQKTNLNSGTFGQFVKDYAPNFGAQDISNSIWLVDNESIADKFCVGKNLSNPASIKQAIRKELKAVKYESEALETEAYDAYGMKVPKSTAPKPPVYKKDKDGEVTQLDKATIDQLLPVIDHAIEVLERKMSKSAQQFNKKTVAEIENLSYRLANLSISGQKANSFTLPMPDIAVDETIDTKKAA